MSEQLTLFYSTVKEKAWHQSGSRWDQRINCVIYLSLEIVLSVSMPFLSVHTFALMGILFCVDV
uniref:Uncharacterized protein n=1 Tax=Anguilla anguilla TaxID=7936 RepID=A0A0E9RMX1_ANGAN